MFLCYTMTASAISVSTTKYPFNEKCHYNPIFTSASNELNENHHENKTTSCIMPYIYDSQDNMTAMTNGISSTPGGAPIIEISKSPNKNDKTHNNNINQQHTQGVYREKDANQHTARGMCVKSILIINLLILRFCISEIRMYY